MAEKGRRATRNIASARFTPTRREMDDDWLDDREGVDGVPPPLRTTVTPLRSRTIVTRNTSPDVPFDRSVNAYVGCDHAHTVVCPRLGAGIQSSHARISRQRRTRLNGSKVTIAQGGRSAIVKTMNQAKVIGPSKPTSYIVITNAQATSHTGSSARKEIRLNRSRERGRKAIAVARTAPTAAATIIVESANPSHICGVVAPLARGSQSA